MPHVQKYQKCKQKANRLSNGELAAVLKHYRRKKMSTSEQVCYEALEDEAVNRLIERF